MKMITPPEGISFFTEDIEFKLENPDLLKQWILMITSNEGVQLHTLNYIFCSDQHLHSINIEYLDHDTLTDIITFHYNEAFIQSDIFISVERTRDNAKSLRIPESEELHRVMIHGVLHMCGFGDKTKTEQKIMRAKENECLALLEEMS